jgi:putative ABC transport system permease protein
MSLLTIIRMSFRSLFANGMRSVLAVLGIVIGVSSVIALLMLGTAAQNMVLNRMSSLGTNLIVISPGASGSGGVTSGTLQNLTVEDARALVEQVSGIRFVSPLVSGPAQVKYMSSNSRVNVVGVAPTYFSIRNFEVERGRCFNDSECDRLSRVAIIGPTCLGPATLLAKR